MGNHRPDESPFQSWAYWRRQFQIPEIYSFFDQREYHFPEPIWKYDRAIKHRVCRFCDGVEYFMDTDDTEHWCICKLLAWQEAFSEWKKKYSSPIRPKALDTFEIWGDDKSQKSLERALRVTKQWIQHPDTWVCYLGNVGSGKTHLAGAIYAAYEPISIFITVGDLKQKLFDTWKTKGDTIGDITHALRTVPLLVLDDWGMEQGGNNDWVATQFIGIINHRYNSMLSHPTIVTTNMTKEMITQLPENMRADDRILEDGNHHLSISAESHRRRNNGTPAKTSSYPVRSLR